MEEDYLSWHGASPTRRNMTVFDIRHISDLATLADVSIIIEFAIARTLRERGWIVPAYTMAINLNGSDSTS